MVKTKTNKKTGTTSHTHTDKIYVVRQRMPMSTAALGVFHYFERFLLQELCPHIYRQKLGQIELLIQTRFLICLGFWKQIFQFHLVLDITSYLAFFPNGLPPGCLGLPQIELLSWVQLPSWMHLFSFPCGGQAISCLGFRSSSPRPLDPHSLTGQQDPHANSA